MRLNTRRCSRADPRDEGGGFLLREDRCRGSVVKDEFAAQLGLAIARLDQILYSNCKS